MVFACFAYVGHDLDSNTVDIKCVLCRTPQLSSPVFSLIAQHRAKMKLSVTVIINTINTMYDSLT